MFGVGVTTQTDSTSLMLVRDAYVVLCVEQTLGLVLTVQPVICLGLMVLPISYTGISEKVKICTG